MIEKTIANLSLEQRTYKYDTESPRMCHVRALQNAFLRQEIPNEIIPSIIKYAERRKDEVGEAIKKWNNYVLSDYITTDKEIDDLAYELCKTYGILGEDYFENRESENLDKRVEVLVGATVKLFHEEHRKY